ncbi:MAG: hypothetical protein LBU68_02920 [Rickettsiales bacterium]|jgi:hypothetical protein|nr:hypothetical protein [Rickettsiales bacterium]
MINNIKKLNSSITYKCNGTNNIFEIPFQIFDKNFIKVYIDEYLQSDGYEVKISDEGGSLIMKNTPLSGSTITIAREMELKRNFDFQTGGKFRAEDLNYELNYQSAYISELQDSLKVALAYKLPAPKSGATLVWNADESGFENCEIENIPEYANKSEDFYNLTNDLYHGIIQALVSQNNGFGFIGILNNLISLLKKDMPIYFDDFGHTINGNFEVVDYGNLGETTDEKKDYGSVGYQEK